MMPARWTVLSVALAASIAGCGRSTGEPAASREPAIPVSTAMPVRKTITRTTTQPGYLEAFEDAPIYAKIAGYVERLHVDIGDRVHGPHYSADGKRIEPGQLLLELSVPELDEELRQKQALVRRAEAALQQARSQVKVDEARRASAESNFQRWQSENERVAELVRGNAVTSKLGDETRQQYEAARAEVNQASAQVEKSKADVQSADAQLQVASADEQRVAALVSYTKIRAPFDGVISRRNTNLGHFVPAGAEGGGHPVFMLVKADVVRVFLDVPELDAAWVDVGDPALIDIDALNQGKIEATVTRISWALDETARTLHAEVDIPNPRGELRPGMYARVTIAMERRENALVVPRGAVARDADQTFCWTITDGTAKRIPVQNGIVTDTEVEIRDGLAPDQPVIVSGLSALKSGQPVQIISPPKS